jgi:hypothetical protein
MMRARLTVDRRSSRGAELEEDLAASQEKAERAEQWLHRLYGEIKEQFQR